MSVVCRRFSADFKVEAAHRVIDTGRSVAEVARELTLDDALLVGLVRVERAELLRVPKPVSELEKDNAFMGKGFAHGITSQ